MLKKILSNFLIIAILLGFFPFNSVYADLDISTFQINGSSSSDFYFNPDDTFTITAYSTNNIWEDIQNARVKVEFNNNWVFNYSWTDQRAQVQWVDTFNPIPAWDYSSSTWLDTPISNTNVTSWQFLMLKKISNAQSAFEISDTITSYTNTVNVSFNAEKVSDSSSVPWSSSSKNIYVNVKPHIIDKYFEKSSVTTTTIKWNWAESVDLFVKVKDYNWCTNIDNNNVTADLSLLGLSSTEPLIYNSCEGDGKTAIFKKSWITTLAWLWTKVFNHSDFSFSDEDGNSIDTSDSNFVESWETDSLSITVESPWAPDITDLGIVDDYIWGPWETSTTLSFSANQSGDSKVVLDNCTETDINKIFEDTTVYSWSTVKNILIDSSKLIEWNNNIFACVDNGLWDIGSYNFNITKDTTNPIINLLSYTANITTQNVSLDYTCNEDWEYKIEVSNGSWTTVVVDYTNTIADTEVNTSIPHTNLELWTNTITVYCRDNANNEVSTSGSVNKVPPTPTMAWEVTWFIDNDIDNNWLNWIDIKIDWNSSIGSSFAYFESWRIYLLPSSTTLNTSTHNYISLIADSSSGSYIWNESLTIDSDWDTLVNWGSYKAYIAIMGRSWELWDAWESGITTLVSDSIEQASIISAEFISDTQLKLYTDTSLDTVLWSHDESLISFDAWWNKTATSIDSVSWQNIIVNIPSLWNTSITGTNLTIWTWALHSSVGWYNNLINWVSISDKQSPDISSFSNNTAPVYWNYYNDNLDVSWISWEDLVSWNTYIQFLRASWNTDISIHKANITNSSLLLAGVHSTTIQIDSNNNSNEVLLTCWTTYTAQFIWEDSSWNTRSSSTISNIWFDNCSPDTPIQNELILEWSSDFDLTWIPSLDDNWNGSGIRDYTLELFSWNACSIPYSTFSWVTITGQSISLINWDYSWNIKSIDNIWNESSTSTCDDFSVNSNIPTFSNDSITDTILSNTSYAKDWNSVEIEVDILNTDINNITADLSALTWNIWDTSVSCSSPTAGITCSYVWNTITYWFILWYAGSISEWVRQIDIIANNTSWINTRNKLVSITVDKNNPVVTSNAITYPNGWETVGWTWVTITWNTWNVSDTIWLSTVDIHIVKWLIDQWSICSWVNIGSCLWDITSVTSDNDYSIELKATDLVWNVSIDTSDLNFTVDRNAPIVPNNTIMSPNGWGIYKGGETINLIWNDSWIIDAGWLSTNPITLEYSSDNWSNYNQISTNESNDWIYLWTLPSINSSQVFTKLIAVDNVTNSNNDISDSSFIIDSTNPSLNINFAWNGWNTPQNWKYINNSWFNLTLISSDDYMDNVYYSFENKTDWTYWNGTSFTWTVTNNILCSDSILLWTDNSCDSITTTISPTIIHSYEYRMIMYAIDEAWNLTTSTFVDYIWDIVSPSVNISNSDWIFISSDITFEWTSSDTDSWISSVYIQIKKWSDYWDGTSFVNSIESLLTDTSDNYLNWSYNFTLPIWDNDGQDYDITVISNDNAFKINNSTNSSITITKDSSWPIIWNDTITGPTAWSMFAGWDNITISWNTTLITDWVSWLIANPIQLEYFNWASYNLIADSLINNWSYSWDTIPSIDTNNARIRIIVTDNAWNVTFQNSDAFSIDSTNPTIDTIKTIENNISNWKINALKIRFSENIDDSSIIFWDFSIDGWTIIPIGVSTGASTDDDEILLLFNETWDTWDTPTLRYTWTSVGDLSGRKLENTATMSSSDEAIPRVLDIEVFDNNSNWKLDKIEINYSEWLNNNTTISGWNIDNILSWMSINSLSISWNTIHLFLWESNNFDTSSNSLTLDLSTPIYSDSAWNTVESFSNLTLDDKAKPIKLSTQTLDLDSDYKADTIRLNYSENIIGENLWEFSIWNLSIGTTVSSIWVSWTQLDFTLNETTDDNDTDNAFNIEYTWTNLWDSSGNKVSTLTAHISDDIIEPKLLSKVTIDSNSNGQIDGIVITTSENLNDTFTSTNISVEWYTVNSYITWIANDNIFTLDIIEKTVSDTSVTPNIRVVSNSSLWDVSDNIISNELWTTAADDKVWPVITGARYDEVWVWVVDDIIYITFSEDINVWSIDTSAWGSSNNFEITLWWILWWSATTSIISANELKVTLWAGSTALTAGTSKIWIKTWSLSDNNTNISPTVSNNNRVIVSASVILNEVMFSSNSDNQYIELKNLWSSSIDISGWLIENAGWNWIDLTINSWNIVWNWFYLIAKKSSWVSLLNVTPNLIDNTINLNSVSQNNLVLSDGITTYDTAIANIWPAWDNSTPKSMERKINPGDGSLASSWYTAETSTGFDNTTINWTPGIANVFDWLAPNIDSYFPNQNELLPIAWHIRFNYSDAGVWVNSATALINLQKWNWSSYWSDTSWTDITSNDINNSRSIYILDDLDYWRYRTQFSISDNAGNIINEEIVFYIDNFSMKITWWNIHIWDITPSLEQFSTWEITLTVNTLWAWFNISQSKSGLFTQWINNIWDYNWNYGFGFDLYKNENWSINNYSSTISQIDGSNINNISKNIDTNGVLKTYTYKLKLWVKTDSMQEPWKYSKNIKYSLINNY